MKKIDKNQLKRVSKRMSYVLRHQPSSIGIKLDEQGWIDVEELLEAFAKNGVSISRSLLETVVENNDKKRFSFSDDGSKIRANQGHSVNFDLGLASKEPLEFLYHGTAVHNTDSIKETGIQKRNRHHVHLSPDEKTAHQVGSRHGKPIILVIHAKAMFDAGFEFFESENGVWLTDEVPLKYIEFPD